MDIEETNSATPATAKYISARKNEPVACTIRPTIIGVEIPADVAAKVHDPAQEAGAFTRRENGRDDPIQATPAQEEQRAGEQHDHQRPDP